MKTKKLLSVFLSLCIMGTMLVGLTLPTSAATSGYYTYWVSSGKATITNCDKSISGDVIIPSTLGGCPVTNILSWTFANCNNITSITIPDGVTNIGSYLFYKCSSLTNITIPDSVTSIDDSAFKDCSSLTSISIPDSVTSIDSYAFYNCSSLTSITIGNGVTKIGQEAFRACNSLTDITIPDSVTSIGDSAFKDCSSLTSITLPFVGSSREASGTHDAVFGYIFGYTTSSANATCQYYKSGSSYYYYIPTSLKTVVITDATQIPYGAFYNCSKLESITIPDSVTSIGNYAFFQCLGLKSVTIPDGVTSVGESAFYGCISLKSATILAASTEHRAFANCSNLISVNIGNAVTSIGNYVFENCTSLKSITLPDSVTSIGQSAFEDCSSLTSITLPDSVTRIGSGAFNNTAYYKNSSNWQDNVLYIGKNLIDAKDRIIAGSYEIKEGTKVIAESALANCFNLTSITIPDSVTNIGDSAFVACIKLVNITIPDSVTSIGDAAFSDCYDLTTIAITDSVTSIGYNAFYKTAYYKNSLNWQDDVLYVGNHLINFNKSIAENYVIKAGTKTIAGNAFYDCNKLISITIPDSLISIGDSAFYQCASLKTVYYCGTVEQWNKISINANNQYLTKATRYFHNYESVVTSPTCTTAGYTTYRCVNCGDSYISDKTDAFGHAHKGVVMAPTCITAGYTTYTCTCCGDSYTADEVEALGHSYDNSCDTNCNSCGEKRKISHDYKVVVTPSTCIENGHTTYTCTVCGDSYTIEETVLGAHNYKSVVTAPTTTTQGYTTYICTVCGSSYKGSYTDATGTINGVQNMKLTPSDTNIVVTWDAHPNATAYNLYVKNGEGTTVITRKLAATATSYTLSWSNDIEWDKNYVVGVGVKTTKWLNTVWKDSALVVGDRIVDVKTQSVGRTIKVTWKAYEGATQYYVHVYEKGASKAFTSVKATTNEAYIVNAINPEVDYTVKVVATKGVSMKAADAMQIPARLNVFTPNTFAERGVTPNKVAVSWDEVRGVDKYWVYLTPVGGGEVITKEATKTIASVGGLTPNTTYEVKLQVRITDANGNKHYSGASGVLGTITTTGWEDINFKTTNWGAVVNLSWTAPANASGYIIYRSTDNGKSYKKIATITDAATVSHKVTSVKNGYIYGIIVQLKDDYVTTKSEMVKAAPIVK